MAKSSHKEDSYKEEAEAQIRGGVGGGEWWVEKGACASILSARSVGFDPTTKYDYRDAHPVTIHSPLWLSSLGQATTAVGSAEPRQLLVPMQRSIGNVWPADSIGTQTLSTSGQTSASRRSSDYRQAA